MKILNIFLLLFCNVFSQTQDNQEYPPVDYPSNYESSLNLVYSSINGWEGKLDIYFPYKTEKPVPLVINIHGGGWRKGVKESQRDFKIFFDMGWAVANISYRLSGIAKAPAAIVDCKNALIFLVNNSEKFNIDPLKIITIGGSAGGHLALMTGLLPDENDFEGVLALNKEYKVKAIINKYGITDIQDILSQHNRREFAVEWIKGSESDTVFLKSISPIYYVNESSPAVLTIHGDADPTVPYQQAIILHEALDQFQIENSLVTVPNGKHGKFSSDENKKNKIIIGNFLLKVIDD